jgi:hypothetical protein
MDYSEDYNNPLTIAGKFYDNTLCDDCQRNEAELELESNLCGDCMRIIGG